MPECSTSIRLWMESWIALTHKILDAALQLLPFHVAGVALSLGSGKWNLGVPPAYIFRAFSYIFRHCKPATRNPCQHHTPVVRAVALFFRICCHFSLSLRQQEQLRESFCPLAPPTAGFNISCYISLHAQIYCRVMGNAACYSENVCEIPLMPPVLLDFCEGLRDTFWCCWSDIGQNKVVSLFSLACSSAFIRLLLMARTELLWFIFRHGLFWVYCFEPHMPHMHAA